MQKIDKISLDHSAVSVVWAVLSVMLCVRYLKLCHCTAVTHRRLSFIN